MKKKSVVGMMVLAMMFAITACGKDSSEKTAGKESRQESIKSTESGDGTEAEEKKEDNKEKNNAEKNDLSVEALLEREETDISELLYEIEEDGVHIIQFWGDSEVVVIPAQIEGKAVVKIEAAFTNDSSVKGVVIPETVHTFGVDAFANCTSLETVAIKGNGLTLIDGRCFINCENLKNINLPDSLQRIEGLAFCGCTSLTELDIPENVEYMEQSVFANSGMLK